MISCHTRPRPGLTIIPPSLWKLQKINSLKMHFIYLPVQVQAQSVWKWGAKHDAMFICEIPSADTGSRTWYTGVKTFLSISARTPVVARFMSESWQSIIITPLALIWASAENTEHLGHWIIGITIQNNIFLNICPSNQPTNSLRNQNKAEIEGRGRSDETRQSTLLTLCCRCGVFSKRYPGLVTTFSV